MVISLLKTSPVSQRKSNIWSLLCLFPQGKHYRRELHWLFNNRIYSILVTTGWNFVLGLYPAQVHKKLLCIPPRSLQAPGLGRLMCNTFTTKVILKESLNKMFHHFNDMKIEVQIILLWKGPLFSSSWYLQYVS